MFINSIPYFSTKRHNCKCHMQCTEYITSAAMISLTKDMFNFCSPKKAGVPFRNTSLFLNVAVT